MHNWSAGTVNNRIVELLNFNFLNFQKKNPGQEGQGVSKYINVAEKETKQEKQIYLPG